MNPQHGHQDSGSGSGSGGGGADDAGVGSSSSNIHHNNGVTSSSGSDSGHDHLEHEHDEFAGLPASNVHWLMDLEEHDDYEDEDYEDAPEEHDDDDDLFNYDDGDESHPPGHFVEYNVVIGADELGDDDTGMGVQELLNLLSSHGPGAQQVRRQILETLGRQGVADLLTGELDEDGGSEGILFPRWSGRRPRRYRRPPDPNRFPKVPSEKGRELLRSGAFGTNGDENRHKPQMSISRRLLERELGLGGKEQRARNRDLIVQDFIPQTRAEHIVHFDDPIYSGQFSEDGNFFYACCQDFKVRMYDTSNPYDWKHYKTVPYNFGQWTLTDATLSPDNKWLAYTSISEMVSLAPTDPQDTGEPYVLNLNPEPNSEFSRRLYTGIWSVRFSGDGRELIAGTNTHCILIYDIESRRVLHEIEGHSNDVNAVCFADKYSPHILYSGSDDATIKIWDRRSMADGREAGAFVGHIEGLTYIDSKDDGRYVLSNGKDQSMKLWDLRMAYSSAEWREMRQRHGQPGSGFDYRSGYYDDDDWYQHPADNSVVTFRGHKVLRTLIRCHFSPPSSTNSRYVYTGSSDGSVHIYNLDATKAGIIDVEAATEGTRRGSTRRARYRWGAPGQWATCVRDASWHPNAPVMAASAWNGPNMAQGTVSLHSYNVGREDDDDERPMGRSYNELMQTDPNLFQADYTNVPY